MADKKTATPSNTNHKTIGIAVRVLNSPEENTALESILRRSDVTEFLQAICESSVVPYGLLITSCGDKIGSLDGDQEEAATQDDDVEMES
jgi:hypothetical protein